MAYKTTFLPLVLMNIGCMEYNINKGNGLLGPAGEGSIAGKVCDPSGDTYLVGALVYVDIDMNGDGKIDRQIEDTSDAEGNDTNSNDSLLVSIRCMLKKDPSTLITVNLQTETHLVAEEECKVDPPNIAVIKGSYDHIEDIISALGN